MELARTRYEVRVGTLLSHAVVAAFRLPLRRIAVPRNTVYRLSVPADRDLGEVLHRLTESDVQVLEIRRCLEVSPRTPDRTRERPEASPSDVGPTDATADGVVVPFRGGSRRPGGSPQSN
jgi:hypothetical protein